MAALSALRMPTLGRLPGAHRARLAMLTMGDAVQDRWYRIDTRPASHTPPMEAEYVGYYPLSYTALWRIRRAMALTADDVVYDLGCGKGRAICLLSASAAGRVIGIECDRRHAVTALDNVRWMRGRRALVEVRCADATTPSYADATAILMYNPFGPKTLAAVLDRLHESLRANPRRLRIFYAHPVHERVLAESGWLDRVDTFTVPFQITHRLAVMVWQASTP